ncbi:MAG: hypothetical protein J6M17_05290 [Ruminococcus sp.]|nr:hypothetical protein [Ruminococcus sp.]
MKKKTIALIAAAAVIVTGISVFTIRTSEKAEAQAQKAEKEQQQRELIELSKPSLPILTLNDTDENDRRYGYDVLYKKDGITITLDESILQGDPRMTLSITNDTDSEKHIESLYIVPECYLSNAAIDVTVAPKSTETVEVRDFMKYLRENTVITDMKFRFIITDADSDEITYTKQITVSYKLPQTQPSHGSDSSLLYENNGFELYFDDCFIDTDDDGDKRVYIDMYAENHCGYDVYLSTKDTVLYRKGIEEDRDSDVNLLFPDNTGHYFHFYYYIDNDAGEEYNKVSFKPLIYGAFGEDIYFDLPDEPVTVYVSHDTDQ